MRNEFFTAFFSSKTYQFFDRFRRTEIPLRAAALAYHTLLAIVPALGLIFWYLTAVGMTRKWLDLSREFILTQLNVSSSENFAKTFDGLTANVNAESAGIIGIVLLVYTLASLISRFGESLDAILGTAANRPISTWNFWRLMFRRMVVMLGLPLALTLSLVISQWIRRDSWLHLLFDLKSVGPFLLYLIPLSVDIVVFFSVYYFIPRNPVPSRQALRAALIVAPISEAVRLLFGLYNTYAVSVHRIYGVLAVIPMFILWIQVAWMVILAGALFIKFRVRKSTTR